MNKDWPKKNDSEILPTPQTLETDTVYTVQKLGDIVITGFKDNNFTYRPENKNDMLCGDDPQVIPPENLKPKVQPIDMLYDSDGHLIAWLKYSRGC